MAEAKGKPAIAALIDGDIHRALMADGDRAVACGHSVVFRNGTTGFEVWRVSANRWELVRTDDGWRVERRLNAPLDGSEAARALLGISG